MAARSRILAWRIPWTEEPDGLQSIESDTTYLQLWPGNRNDGLQSPRLRLLHQEIIWSLPPLGHSSVLTPEEHKALSSAAAFSMQQNLNSTSIFTLVVAAREAVTLEAKRGRKKRRGNSQPRGSFHSCPASQWQGYGECWPAHHFASLLVAGHCENSSNCPSSLCPSVWLPLTEALPLM